MIIILGCTIIGACVAGTIFNLMCGFGDHDQD